MSTTDLVALPQGEQSQGGADDGPQDGSRRRKRDKAERELLRLQIAERLIAHIPYRTIAAHLGISKDEVYREVKKIRAAWKERSLDAYETHVAEEVGKLDALERYVLPTAMHGAEGKPNLAAVDRALSIMDRRARLLGLDKPHKLEVSGQIDLVAKKARAEELVEQVRKLHAV